MDFQKNLTIISNSWPLSAIQAEHLTSTLQTIHSWILCVR